MATTSAANGDFPFQFLPPVTEKLTRGNHAMWLAQVTSTLQGARLWRFTQPSSKSPEEFLATTAADDDGKKAEPIPNPAYDDWFAKDSQVRSYLFASLSKDVFSQVASSSTAAELWTAIQELQASRSRARIMATRMALATAQKGSSTVAEYFTKMKGLADEMASAGKRLEDDELVSYILMGLGEEFDPVVTSVSNRTDPISLYEVQAQLVPMNKGARFVMVARTHLPTLLPREVVAVASPTRVAALVAVEVAEAVLDAVVMAAVEGGAISKQVSSARSVALRGIRRFAATNGLTPMSPVLLLRRVPTLQPIHRMGLTPIGTWTQEPRIISPVNSTSSL